MFIGVDESGIAPDYLVIATVWFPNDVAVEFERRVAEWRINSHFWREITFKGIDARSVPYQIEHYLEFMDIAFDLGVELKAIVIRNALTDISLHDNNPRIMQLNFLGLLLRRKLQKLPAELEEEIHVVTDKFMGPDAEMVRTRTTLSTEGDVWKLKEEEERKKAIPYTKERIARAIGKEVACFAQCTSHICSSVQLADLLAGSIGIRLLNAPYATVWGQRKAIIEKFETHFSHSNLSKPTLPSKKGLDIWIWRPPIEHV